MINSDTVPALMKIYDVTYQQLSLHFRMTKQGVIYLVHHDRLKEYQKEIVLDVFLQLGLETAELMLIHQMTYKAKKHR